MDTECLEGIVLIELRYISIEDFKQYRTSRILPDKTVKSDIDNDSRGVYHALVGLSLENQETEEVGYRPVGTLILANHHKEEKFTKLLDFEIHEEYRGYGYGRKVMQQVIDEAKSYGASYLQLFVFEHRIAARTLYLSLGFTIIEKRKNGYTMRLLL